MPKLPANNPFVSQLLRQDQAVSETSYQEYRMQLEQQLQRAEWLEQITRRVAVSTGIGDTVIWTAALFDVFTL